MRQKVENVIESDFQQYYVCSVLTHLVIIITVEDAQNVQEQINDIQI